VAESHALSFMIAAADEGLTIAAALRGQLRDQSWAQVRRLCTTGKVFVDDERALDPAQRVRAGQRVSLDRAAPRPDATPAGFRIVFEDAHLVVVDKPSGISSVPYDRKETGTAMDLIRAVWRKKGKRATESNLVADRGDGIRGSTRHAAQGQHAITHVEPLRRLRDATLCRVRLETGRTHQIRIHLAERGHPIVGETVYIRDLLRAGRTPLLQGAPRRVPHRPLSSPRLMLHAASLGFRHPVTGVALAWTAAPPADFTAVYESLGGSLGDL
jgi:23S rRNA-/tRNA-specific pseudouridylate synthase